MLAQLEKYLEGKKTYGLVFVGIVLIGAVQLGWITLPTDQVNELSNLITLSAIAAMRAGIK